MKYLPPGWFDYADIQAYREIYDDLPHGAHTVEVGVYRGRSLMAVSEIIQAKDLHVTCIDTFTPFREDDDPDRYGQFIATARRFGIWENLEILAAPSPGAARHIPDGSQDLVFLDGSHDYEQLCAEIAAFTPKLKSSGLMAGHDYPNEDGVRAAVNQHFPHIRQWPQPATIWLQARQAPGGPGAQPLMRLGIVTPSYSPLVVFDDALLKAQRSSRIAGFANWKAVGSLITLGFNCCWCWGLNARRDGITHLLIMHSDIMPESPNWLDTLIDEFWASGADVLSAIVPIKDARGLTSTAFETPNPWRPRRLTQREAHDLPPTWTADNLLLNDGLMLVDFTKPWVEKICFHIHDEIRRNDDGLWQAYVQSEDWDFSRQCHRLSVKQYATRAINLLHHGTMAYPSKDVWGAPHDPDADPYPEGVTITASNGEAHHLKFD